MILKQLLLLKVKNDCETRRIFMGSEAIPGYYGNGTNPGQESLAVLVSLYNHFFSICLIKKKSRLRKKMLPEAAVTSLK